MIFKSNIDNSALVVPVFQTATAPADAEFPNTTLYRRYDKSDHRHYLTRQGLEKYGITPDADDPDGSRLIRTATEHVYDAIETRAQTKYNVQCYRLAKGLLSPYISAVEAYRKIEEKLARQAQHIQEFGDALRTPRVVVSLETVRVRESNITQDDLFWLDDSVQMWLEGCYLLDPNLVYNWHLIDWNSY